MAAQTTSTALLDPDHVLLVLLEKPSEGDLLKVCGTEVYRCVFHVGICFVFFLHCNFIFIFMVVVPCPLGDPRVTATPLYCAT